TWLNYVRCHDDIGLGFDDSDIHLAGYEPRSHRKFLVDYLTGKFDGSPSRGMAFMPNEATGDARICGSLASLVGLESALETADEDLIALAINRILLMHAIILSFGGIPLIYNGDAIAVLNDYSYIDDHSKTNDNRWVHRPKINWEKADLRKKQGTLEHTVFNATKKLIAIRKEISAFADFNNRELVHIENEHLLSFVRFNYQRPSEKVLIIANFDANPQDLYLESLRTMGFNIYSNFVDLYSGIKPEQCDGRITLQGYQFYWLTET
ncbi:MAG: alpha-amylase, partial [Nodularia sp. (in: Bacteria)]